MKKTIMMGLLFVVLATVAIVNTSVISEAYAQSTNPNPNQNPDAKCPPQQQERGKCGKLTVVLGIQFFDPPQSFTIAVTGASPSQSPFQGSSTGTTVSLKEGPYSVSEVSGPLSKYTVSYSPGCSGAMTEGQTILCTITNTPKPATLIVKAKAVCLQGEVCPNLPVYTGSPDETFGAQIFFTEGDNPTPASFWGSEAGTSVILGPGFYNTGETIYAHLAGFELVGSAGSPECNSNSGGLLQPLEVRTCTWTNTFRPVG